MSKRTLPRLTTLACAALLVAGCGSGSDSGDDAAAAGGAGCEAQQGGTLTVQQPFEPGRGLNFLVTDDPSLMQIMSGTVYSKLLEVDPESEEYALTGDLATEWEVSEDGLTYTFQLRDDVVWQDIAPVSGRPFTADDVVATFEGLKASQSPHKWMAEPIASVTAEGDSTVVFQLSQPYAPFLDYMAHHFNVILPREGVEGQFDMGTTAIGTGPYMVAEHTPDVEWVLERNPDYFGEAFLDEIRLPVISDTAAVTAALRSGRLDIATVPFDVAENTFADTPDFQLIEQPSNLVSFDINTTAEPFTDVRVRRAIAMAIDWEGMGESIRGRYNATSLLRPDISPAALTEEELAEVRPYDPEQARELLAEAGYPDGFSTTLLVQQLSESDVREGEWIVADLAEVGIEVEIQIQDPATAVGRRREQQYDLSKAARSVIFPDQTIQDYRTGSRENYAAISDPEVDRMIAESRAELDEEARNEMYREFQRYMETEVAASFLPVQYYQFWVASSRVANYQQSPIYQGSLYADMWVCE
ncbi:ABC transporter substrate-binding protein [Geodermatophilus sabuli]|uniref:ABC transporter substrate-binding protein n=1 Tax=Geodermatophilus sabuli TaxID=1564158 RepID=A0A7K3W1B1_9ACTN|nr:ABC transporter substrate-binding protein [Geodermatophilus sabuli]NEK57677.1 ABC transporter substrate-binding protein [Geodermatophilus sabuli]